MDHDVLSTTRTYYRQQREKAFAALNDYFREQLQDATNAAQNVLVASLKIGFRHAAHSDKLFGNALPFIPGGIVQTSWYETLRKISEEAAGMDSPAGKALSETFAAINALDDKALPLHPRGVLGGNIIRRVQLAQKISGRNL